MAVNINWVRNQTRNIDNCSSCLRSIYNMMQANKNSLNAAWQGQEMVYINNGIDKATDAIRQLNVLTQELSSDIMSSAYQIQSEEQAALEALTRLK